MSYNPAIPQVGDFVAISQKQMLANFQTINNTFFIDHVPLTAVENVGQHKSLTFINQPGDPATAIDQSAIYSKLDGSSLPQLFFRPSFNQTPIQLTNSNLNTVQTGAPGGTQSSFLAGPFTIYVGYVISCPNLFNVVLTPASTLIYVGITTTTNSPKLLANVNIAAAVNIAGNQFTVRYDPALTGFTLPPTIYYMAIGI